MTTIEYLMRELSRVEADIASARECGDATMDAFYQGVQYALRSVWVEGLNLPSKKINFFFKNLLTFSRTCVIIVILKEGIRYRRTGRAPNLRGAYK